MRWLRLELWNLGVLLDHSTLNWNHLLPAVATSPLDLPLLRAVDPGCATSLPADSLAALREEVMRLLHSATITSDPDLWTLLLRTAALAGLGAQSWSAQLRLIPVDTASTEVDQADDVQESCAHARPAKVSRTGAKS